MDRSKCLALVLSGSFGACSTGVPAAPEPEHEVITLPDSHALLRTALRAFDDRQASEFNHDDAIWLESDEDEEDDEEAEPPLEPPVFVRVNALGCSLPEIPCSTMVTDYQLLEWHAQPPDAWLARTIDVHASSPTTATVFIFDFSPLGNEPLQRFVKLAYEEGRWIATKRYVGWSEFGP